MTHGNNQDSLFGRTIWSLLSSLALHLSWVASLFFALTFLQAPPKSALVDFECVEFSEDAPSSEGDEGQSDTVTEQLKEGEQLVVTERPDIEPIKQQAVVEQVSEDGESSLQESSERAVEANANLKQQLKEQVLAQQRATTQGSLEALEIARRAKLLMRARLKAATAGGSKRFGKRVPTVIERVRSRGDADFLNGLQIDDVIVVQGIYDGVQYVLSHLKIPYRLVTKKTLFNKDLSPKAVLIFNCDNRCLSPSQALKVARFVHAGGYLFSSDWELTNVLARAFPKHLHPRKRLRGSTVSISPHPQAALHPYLRDVFSSTDTLLPGKFKWQVDGASDDPFLKTRQAFPLVISNELRRSGASGVVAFALRTGDGAVLHVISHFRSQCNPKNDGYALQQMLVNFIIEKQRDRLANPK